MATTTTRRSGKNKQALSTQQKHAAICAFAKTADSKLAVYGYAASIPELGYKHATVDKILSDNKIKIGQSRTEASRDKAAADNAKQIAAVADFKQTSAGDLSKLFDEAKMLEEVNGRVTVEGTASAHSLLGAASSVMGQAIRDRQEEIANTLPDGVYDNATGDRSYTVSGKETTRIDADAMVEHMVERAFNDSPQEAIELWDSLHGAASYRDGALRELAGDAGIDQFYGEVLEGAQGVQPFLARARSVAGDDVEEYKGHSVAAAKEAYREYVAVAESMDAIPTFSEAVNQKNAGNALSELEKAQAARAAVEDEKKNYELILGGTARPGDVICDSQDRPVMIATSSQKRLKPNHDAVKALVISSSHTGTEVIRRMSAIASPTWKAAGKERADDIGAKSIEKTRALKENKAKATK